MANQKLTVSISDENGYLITERDFFIDPAFGVDGSASRIVDLIGGAFAADGEDGEPTTTFYIEVTDDSGSVTTADYEVVIDKDRNRTTASEMLDAVAANFKKAGAQ